MQIIVKESQLGVSAWQVYTVNKSDVQDPAADSRGVEFDHWQKAKRNS